MRSVRRLPLLVLVCLGGVLCLSFYNMWWSTFSSTAGLEGELQTFNTKTKIRSVADLKQEFGFSAAVCVAVKDAEAYFEEWIDFHLAMEFSNLYIYDDSDDFELRNWYQNTRNHSLYSRVQVLHNQMLFRKYETLSKDKKTKKNKKNEERQMFQNRQSFAYHHCVNRFGVNGPKHDYMAFIDIDEFLMLQTSKYSGILGVLDDYLAPYGGALTVNWMFVGDANRTVYSPLPVTKRFQYRDDTADADIKTIVKSTDYFGFLNTHAVALRTGKVHTTEYPGAVAAIISDVAVETRPSDVLLLYHYRYRSRKEYIYKRCITGVVRPNSFHWCSADGNGIDGNGVAQMIPSPGSVFDDRPWQFLKARVPKYQIYDQFEDYHSLSS